MALTEIKTSGIADDAVTTDKLANAINTERTANTAKTSLEDNAVTLAKMAGGTDGQIITNDASGEPVAAGPGTDGQVLTSTGAGSPPAFETPAASGAALTGSTDNTVVTVTGANAIQGESGLTFDGSTMNLTAASGDARLTLIGTEGNDARITLSADDGDDHIDQYNIRSNADDNSLSIDQFESGSFVERFTIANGGTVGIGTDSPGQLLSLKNTGAQCQQSLTAATNGSCAIYFGDTDSVNRSVILHHNTGDYLSFSTAGSERLRVLSDGGLTFNGDTATANAIDDYEEGTWDVVATGAESGATSTYTDTGWYTKIGRVVHCHVKLHNVTFPALGGLLYLSAPFTAKNDIIARGVPCYWEPTSVWDDYTDMVGMQPVITQSANQFHLDILRKDEVHTSQSAGSGGRNGNLSEASGVYLQFTITYFI